MCSIAVYLQRKHDLTAYMKTYGDDTLRSVEQLSKNRRDFLITAQDCCQTPLLQDHFIGRRTPQPVTVTNRILSRVIEN